MIDEAYNKGDYGRALRYWANNEDHSLDGEKGFRNGADLFDKVGTYISYTKVGAPLGAAFGILSDAMHTGADVAESKPNAAQNFSVRVTNTLINHLIGKKVNLLKMNETKKQVVKGAVNHATGEAENEITKDK